LSESIHAGSSPGHIHSAKDWRFDDDDYKVAGGRIGIIDRWIESIFRFGRRKEKSRAAGGKPLLIAFFQAKWYIYASGVIFILAANLFQAYFPRVLGQFTDELQRGVLTASAIGHYSLLLVGIGIIYALLGGIGQFHIMYVGRIFEYFARKRLFHHFTVLGERFYAKRGVGNLLSYVMNDITSVRESISMGINQTTNTTLLMITAVTAMLASDIPFYLIGVCVLPVLLIPYIVVRFGPVIRERSLAVQDALGTMTESAEEQFAGIRVTKKFAVEPIMIRKFSETVDRIRDRQVKLVRVSSIFQALIPFLGALSLIITLAFGGYLAMNGTITLGNFVALTLYIRMMITPLQQIGNVINTMQRSRASLARLNNLFGERADISELEHAVEKDLTKEPLVVDHLSFAYPGTDREVLRDISFTLKPGRTLGIVGRTGSGKTTLIKLLLRIYDAAPGTVRAGDTDLRELTLSCLRDSIAYVPQDGFLFSTTIRDNISFHNREAEFGTVEHAARTAQIAGSIPSFADGYETKLGERGVTMSGGQRQRTSLARGLMKDAPVLILDDSVSAVDAVTEKRIIEAVREERAGKTTIIIAHRISALKHAGEIIVLDQGRIAQRGTHEELLAEPGIYAELHAIQEEGSRDGTGD
jgi:ABC-type multidrug transport system, ATPase and permease components